MNIQELEGKRIAVLLSGGVDSSVVVYEFARLGLHPAHYRNFCLVDYLLTVSIVKMFKLLLDVL
mgnify:CR=1 FL=1